MREFDQIGTSTDLTPLTTKYAYDPLDQLLRVTDAKENVTSTVYDTVGQIVTLTSPDAGQTEYRFDLNGNLKEQQTPSSAANQGHQLRPRLQSPEEHHLPDADAGNVHVRRADREGGRRRQRRGAHQEGHVRGGR